MDLNDAASQNWQEERYTLQRLLVRTSLFAAGQDVTIDALLDNLRNALRHESCELDVLRRLQHDLDQALELLDDKRAQSERQLKASTAAILEALDNDGDASKNARKQYRSLEKKIDKLELDGEVITAWLAELAALTVREQAGSGSAKDESRGGWRRFFSRQESESCHENESGHESEPDSAKSRRTFESESAAESERIVESESTVEPKSTVESKPGDVESEPETLASKLKDIEPSLGTIERSDFGETDQRLRIARRIGELLGHVLEQVSLEAKAHARALHLKQLLEQSYEWNELRDALNEIVDLVIAAVSRGRSEFEDFLKRLDERLAALKANCEAQVEAGADRRSATDALDEALNSQLKDIGSAVSQATSLDQLKASVTRNIQSISDSFRKYRDEERSRETVLEEKLAAMQEKLAGMEAYSEQVQEQLRTERSRALTDVLTQLPNREAWQQRLELEFDRWRRYAHPITLAVLDIDHFKKVNDSFGHKAGDRVIQLVAKALCDRLRSTDFVARYGGEEFVILLPETDADVAYKVIEDLRLHIASLPFHFQNQPVTITISAGVAPFESAENPEALFDVGDKALYRAKNQGRNRVVRA